MTTHDSERRRSCRKRRAFNNISHDRTLLKGCQHSHVTSYTWVAINPPRSPQTGLSVKQAKLIKSQSFLQPASHCDTRFPCTHNNEGIVGVCILFVSIDNVDCIRQVSHDWKTDQENGRERRSIQRNKWQEGLGAWKSSMLYS